MKDLADAQKEDVYTLDKTEGRGDDRNKEPYRIPGVPEVARRGLEAAAVNLAVPQ